MLISEMTAEECREFLAHTGFGRLGCASDNEPYVVPFYFAYKEDRMYGVSTMGRKIQWMRANPKVCVEADEVTNHFRWTSVIARGQYMELPDTPRLYSERVAAQMELEGRTLW